MKKLIFLMVLSTNLMAQTIPSKHLNNQNIPMLIFEKPAGIDELIKEQVDKHGFYEFGKFIYYDISPKTHGNWTESKT